MILPTKHLNGNRALLTVGAEIIRLLSRPKSISRLWDDLKHARNNETNSSNLIYSWFILTLDLLYLLKAIEFRDDGMIQIVNYDSPNL
jgi:hypothetical protein